MADFGMTMKVKTAEYRPCTANGKKALFHRWVESDKYLLETHVCMDRYMKANLIRTFKDHGYIDGAVGTIKTIKTLYGLVEYEDGTMDKVDPEKIVFKDSKIKFEEAGS